MKTNHGYFCCALFATFLFHEPAAVDAANMSLEPPVQEIVRGVPFTFTLHMDFHDEPALGGGIDIIWSPVDFELVSWDPIHIGEVQFYSPGDTSTPGRVDLYAFGDFAGVSGPFDAGFLTLNNPPPATLNVPILKPINLAENLPLGQFFSAVTFEPMLVDMKPGFVYTRSAGAPVVRLLPYVQTITEEIPFSLTLWMDVTSMPISSGALDLRWDPNSFSLVSWVPNQIGDPAMFNGGEAGITPGMVRGLSFGDPNDLAGAFTLGTLTLRPSFTSPDLVGTLPIPLLTPTNAVFHSAFNGQRTPMLVMGTSGYVTPQAEVSTVGLLPWLAEVERGEDFTLTVRANFRAAPVSDDVALNISWDPAVYELVSWNPTLVGEPSTFSPGDTAAPGLIRGFTFGDAAGLSGAHDVGALTVRVCAECTLPTPLPAPISLGFSGPAAAARSEQGTPVQLVNAAAYATIPNDDHDGWPDLADNCVALPNFYQRDTDGDGIGNACDPDIAVPNDCIVNFLDLNVMADAFFTNPLSPSWNPDADFNGDNQVNFLDLNIMKAYFFASPGPSGLPTTCGCGVADQGLDNTEAFSVPMYVRGSFDDWADPPDPATQLVNFGDGVYQAEFPIGAGSYAYQIASEEWAVQYGEAGNPTMVGLPQFVPLGGPGTDIGLTVTDGCFNFRVTVTDPLSPPDEIILMVTQE